MTEDRKTIYRIDRYIPDAYIPIWLMRVSTKLISSDAKILYGKLCQLANQFSRVSFSLARLCAETGLSKYHVLRGLNLLISVNLICEFHPEDRGIKNYEILFNEWINIT